MDAHVVAHTHWDREWYHPVERFRQRLVALVDELIDEPPAGAASFLLDGQTIILDDYLAVRPERAAELYRVLRDGRLEAGPWYVLADELIPSGEALARNLLAGRRTLRRIGIESPPVLYCPDSFGHPAALPSVAAGFGLPLIILWRGYGGARWPTGDVVRWIAPSGDEALVYHLPRDGYEFGSHLPAAAAAAAERWARIRRELSPRSTTGVELIPNGADHHARQLHQREAVAALAAAAAPDVVHGSSLRAFSRALVAAARAVEPTLPVVHGEFRDSYGYTWTLQGTLATRAHEKRMNAHAERLLVRETEPWAALAARIGRSRRPLVEIAWRTLLEAHPHDTLCGCSIDEVAEAMELRIRSATNQAIGIRDDSILQLAGHDPVEARESRDRWTALVLVRNPVARPRSGVAIVDVERFIADVPVGPGSAAQPIALSTPAPPSLDALGRVQDLSIGRESHELTESPRHYPDNDLVTISRVAMWASDVPGYGVIAAGRVSAGPEREVTMSAAGAENGHYRLSVDDAGVVAIEHAESGRRIAPLVEWVHETDVGDLYTPAPRRRPTIVELHSVRWRGGPLITGVVVIYHLRSTFDGPIEAAVDLSVSLEADAPWVRVAIEGSNRSLDHRLRARFRGDVADGDVWADAAFGPVRREPIVVSAEDAAMEIPPTTAPLHRYVSRFDADRGFTLISDGLAEYEAEEDGSLVVTLFRSVDQLSRGDLSERPGHAGWPKPTAQAQCIGPFAGSFAVMLHGPRTAGTIDVIERAADDVLLPLCGATLRSALRVPEPVHGVELKGVGLAVSAIKESDDGRWLVLRCVNLLDEPVSGSWTLPFEPIECVRARLDETATQELSSTDRTVRFDAKPREIVTILVR